MLKYIVIIIGFMLAMICLSISFGYHDEYQRHKRWPYYKEETGKDIKATIWLGIGTIIVYITAYILNNLTEV